MFIDDPKVSEQTRFGSIQMLVAGPGDPIRSFRTPFSPSFFLRFTIFTPAPGFGMLLSLSRHGPGQIISSSSLILFHMRPPHSLPVTLSLCP